MPIDRRVARTRTALYEALVGLICKKPYDEITVEDILREANVGRSTFYAHFTSKDDLLERSLERLKAILLSAQAQGGSADEPGRLSSISRALFEHVEGHLDLQLALSGGRGGAIVDAAIRGVLMELLEGVVPKGRLGDVPRELALEQIVGTFRTIVKWWLNAPNRVSAKEAERLFATFLVNGVPPLAHGKILSPPERNHAPAD